MGLGEQTQVIRLHGKRLSPLSHPIGLVVVYKYKGHMNGKGRVSGFGATGLIGLRRQQRTGPRELLDHWGIVRHL